MKRKASKCIEKSTSDATNREKVHRETKNIVDLVKKNEISDTSSTMALDWPRSAIGNGNRGMRGGRVI